MTPAQQRAFDDHWARFGLDYTGHERDLDATFGRHVPRVLEIGFGNGEALAWASEHDLARDYIGVEVHGPGVGRLMNALAARDASNVRLYKHDAVEVLENEIPAGSLSEVRIWFPDPWHKKRHNKRRLVQPAFAALLGRASCTRRPAARGHGLGGLRRADVDVLDATQGLVNRAGPRGHVPRPERRPQTHFETRGQKLGHGVWDLLYDRT